MPWLTVWTFIKNLDKKIPPQIWILLGVVLVFSGSNYYSYLKGKHVVQAKWDTSIAEAKHVVKEVKHKQKEVTVKIETIYVDKVRVIHEKGKVLVKEIPVYFHDLPVLDGRFRVQHDSAALGTLPEAADFLNAAPVAAEDFTITFTENYTTCRATQEQLASLQRWIQEQEKAAQPPQNK